MQKPVPQNRKFLDLIQCIKYIESVYGFDHRHCEETYKGTDLPEDVKLDFWYWLVDRYSLKNDSFFRLYITDIQNGYLALPRWIKDIMNMFNKEFKEYTDEFGAIEMLVSW